MGVVDEPLREALRKYLRRLEVRAREERDRAGYSRRPQSADESHQWEAEAVDPGAKPSADASRKTPLKAASRP